MLLFSISQGVSGIRPFWYHFAGVIKFLEYQHKLEYIQENKLAEIHDSYVFSNQCVGGWDKTIGFYFLLFN